MVVTGAQGEAASRFSVVPVLLEAQVELRRSTGRSDVGRFGGQADVGEDAVNHRRVGDERLAVEFQRARGEEELYRGVDESPQSRR